MFLVKHSDKRTKARVGILTTAHGKCNTPFFMPVATKASVKYISPEDLAAMKIQVIINNAFVLFLRPGHEHIKRLGGLHKFMHWKGSIFTDSGGFQMYKEIFIQKTTADGICFKSPFDGKKYFITPEKDMEIQGALGSDVAMCLDSMPLLGHSKKAIKEAVDLTTDWARRCKLHHDKHNKKQLLFGISQGGTHTDLRTRSVKELLKLDFDGYSAGGLALGEPIDKLFSMVALQKSLVPENKPFYVMGLGSPVELLETIALGADMFDSRFPTQNARRGTLFTSKGKLRIKRVEHRLDKRPIDKNCGCFVCKSHTRAYIHYLLKQEEGSGYRLASFHNLFYIQNLMKEAQMEIKKGTFNAFKNRVQKAYQKADQPP